MPELSIIVTSYNLEHYLEESLRSVLGQTLADLEIIVVDDGSTDASPEIITRLADADSRLIPVLLKETSPGGVATAANTGLDLATSPYIGFVDGDDLCEPVMFEKLLGAARTNDADLSMCNYKELDDVTGALSEPADRRRWLDLLSEHYELDVESRKQFLRFIAVPWRKIYRREMLESNRIRFPVSEYFYEDNPFHWFSILSARSVALVPQALCYHRVARDGQTMATIDARLFGMFSHHDTIRDWLRDRGLESVYASSLAGWVIAQTSWIAARTPPELRAELFRTIHAILSGYDESTIEEALDEGTKGRVARRLVHSVRTGSLAEFHQVLDKKGARSSLLEKVGYHLRYDGVRQTARIALSRARRDSGATNGLAGPGATHAMVRNKDVMFALLLLDGRLRTIDERLRQLEDELRRLSPYEE